MGLKSGSRDAGLDDSDEGAENSTEDSWAGDDATGSSVDVDNVRPASEDPPRSDTESDDRRPTMESIPYKLRRNKVNEGREQVPYFLREEVIEAERDLKDTLEDRLGDTVYKSDYREAAMVLAQRRPELVAEVLREWGYDLDSNR